MYFLNVASIFVPIFLYSNTIVPAAFNTSLLVIMYHHMQGYEDVLVT